MPQLGIVEILLAALDDFEALKGFSDELVQFLSGGVLSNLGCRVRIMKSPVGEPTSSF